jgi:hypothetical protein
LGPQAQAPKALQLSATVELHTVQGYPLVPQLVNDFVWQAPATQQPVGHEEALQAGCPQTPLVQVWSTAQQVLLQASEVGQQVVPATQTWPVEQQRLPHGVPEQPWWQVPSALHR